MKRLFFLLLPGILLLGHPPAAGEPGRPHPLARPVRLSLWGESLARTGRAIYEQTGVEVLFYAPDLPASITNAPDVYLVTGDVPLGTALEALARAFAFRFRVTASGKLEISRGYDWVGGEPALRFVRTPPVVRGEEEERMFRDLLSEIVKPLPLLAGDFALRFEHYPLPDRPDNRRGALVLPGVLADYTERALRCLSGERGDQPPSGAIRDAVLFARARDCESDWETLLSRRVRAPGGRDLRSLVQEAAQGLNAVFVLRQAPPASGTPLPRDIDWYTFGRLCEALSSGWGLGKRVFLPCGAVVFEGGDDGGLETDPRSRELFWDGLAVAGFDVEAAAARTRGAAGLTALLRRDVFPGLWRDPVCSMTYSPVFGRLAVVAPVNVLPALAERIAELGGSRR